MRTSLFFSLLSPRCPPAQSPMVYRGVCLQICCKIIVILFIGIFKIMLLRAVERKTKTLLTLMIVWLFELSFMYIDWRCVDAIDDTDCFYDLTFPISMYWSMGWIKMKWNEMIAWPPSQYLKITGRKSKNRLCKSLSLNYGENHNFNLFLCNGAPCKFMLINIC
jgi:hypothetical protein